MSYKSSSKQRILPPLLPLWGFHSSFLPYCSESHPIPLFLHPLLLFLCPHLFVCLLSVTAPPPLPLSQSNSQRLELLWAGGGGRSRLQLQKVQQEAERLHPPRGRHIFFSSSLHVIQLADPMTLNQLMLWIR